MNCPSQSHGMQQRRASSNSKACLLSHANKLVIVSISSVAGINLRKSGMEGSHSGTRPAARPRKPGISMPEYNPDRESFGIELATRLVWIWALHSILDASGCSAGVAAISYCGGRAPQGITGKPSCTGRSALLYHRAAHASYLLDRGEGANRCGQRSSADDLLPGGRCSISCCCLR